MSFFVVCIHLRTFLVNLCKALANKFFFFGLKMIVSLYLLVNIKKEKKKVSLQVFNLININI